MKLSVAWFAVALAGSAIAQVNICIFRLQAFQSTNYLSVHTCVRNWGDDNLRSGQSYKLARLLGRSSTNSVLCPQLLLERRRRDRMFSLRLRLPMQLIQQGSIII